MNFKRVLWPTSLGGKAFAVFAVFFAAVVVTYAIAVWSLTRRLDARLEADRASGLPTTFVEAYGPPVPHGENAEAPLLAAGEIAEKLTRQALQETYGSETPDPRSTDRRNPKYWSSLGRLAEANPEFVQNMAEAFGRPYFTFSARPEDCREPTRRFANRFGQAVGAEAARALAESNAGRCDAAHERLIRLYRFSRRGYEAAPFFDWWNVVNNIIRDKVHWAIDQALISGQASDRTRDRLDEALALAEDNLRSAAWAHQGQKLFLLRNYRGYGQAPYVVPQWFDFPPLDLRNRIEIAETMARTAPRQGNSGNNALDERRRLLMERREKRQSTFYRALLQPAHNATMNELSAMYIPFREIALARCLRVLNELQRRGGAKPDSSFWKLPRAATVDPFTEEPLRIVRTKTGWVVYSLGEERKDTTMEGDGNSNGNYVVGRVGELPHRKR